MRRLDCKQIQAIRTERVSRTRRHDRGQMRLLRPYRSRWNPCRLFTLSDHAGAANRGPTMVGTNADGIALHRPCDGRKEVQRRSAKWTTMPSRAAAGRMWAVGKMISDPSGCQGSTLGFAATNSTKPRLNRRAISTKVWPSAASCRTTSPMRSGKGAASAIRSATAGLPRKTAIQLTERHPIVFSWRTVIDPIHHCKSARARYPLSSGSSAAVRTS